MGTPRGLNVFSIFRNVSDQQKMPWLLKKVKECLFCKLQNTRANISSQIGKKEASSNLNTSRKLKQRQHQYLHSWKAAIITLLSVSAKTNFDDSPAGELNMKLVIYGENIEVTDAIRKYVHQKMETPLSLSTG
jgi:hypothetical protein